MDKSKTILIFILVTAIVYMAFDARSLRKELGITRSQLQKKDRDLSKSIKNNDERRKQAEQREKYWEAIEMNYQDSLAQSRKRTAAATIRYEKLKNTPTPMWNNRELDSLINVIIDKRAIRDFQRLAKESCPLCPGL